MNEDDVQNVDNEAEVESDPISDMLAHAVQGDYVNADKNFNAVASDRVNDILDQARVKIAGQVFNEPEESEAESDDTDVDIDISDEEIEAALENEEELDLEDEET